MYIIIIIIIIIIIYICSANSTQLDDSLLQ